MSTNKAKSRAAVSLTAKQTPCSLLYTFFRSIVILHGDGEAQSSTSVLSKARVGKGRGEEERVCVCVRV